jgi:hypothetical protein
MKTQTEEQKLRARERAKKWRKENLEWSKELDTRKQLRKKYGITLELYNELYAAQEGLCALCCKPETIKLKSSFKTSNLAVDHCHSTGKIRGLLCFRCNTALGQIQKENLAVKIVKYLGESNEE